PVPRADFEELLETGGRPVEQPHDGAGAWEPPAPRALSAPAAAAEPRRRRLLVIEERPRGLLTLVAERAVADIAQRPDDPHGSLDSTPAVGAQEAASPLAAQACHCVVLELGMPGQEGAGFLEAMRGDSALASVPVLVHTGHRVDLAQEQGLRALAGDRPLDFLASLDELRERITLHLSAEQPGDVLSLVRAEEPHHPAAQVVDDAVLGRTI